MANYTDTELTLVMPTENIEELHKLFKEGTNLTGVYYDDFELINSNKYGMASMKFKLECSWNCEETLFKPMVKDCYGLKDLIEKFNIKRLFVFSKADGFNGPFWESAFYDSTENKEAQIEYDSGDLPHHFGCDTYLNKWDKSPKYFKDKNKTYYDEYESDFPVTEEDLKDLEESLKDEEMG